MKRIIIALFTFLIANITVAQEMKKLGFTPLSWHSQDTKDIRKIEAGSGLTAYYLVQIYVNDMYNGMGPNPGGIALKNCGNVTHVKPGSTALCMISYSNPVVTWTADSDESPASGLYQISER